MIHDSLLVRKAMAQDNFSCVVSGAVDIKYCSGEGCGSAADDGRRGPIGGVDSPDSHDIIVDGCRENVASSLNLSMIIFLVPLARTSVVY